MSTIQKSVPALANGQRLSRAEFLRRWEAMPDVKFAELLGGEVFMPSPLRRSHGRGDSDIIAWIGVYAAATPGVEKCSNATWFMPDEETPQPDSDLRVLPNYGGQSSDEGDYGVGAPELASETWSSRNATRVERKLRVYWESGVQEYLALFLEEAEVEWRSRQGESFDPLTADADGIVRSRVFPGLWLDPEALLHGDLARMLQVLHQGLASPEHAAFVARLESQRAARPS